jgi:hypothetical protein
MRVVDGDSALATYAAVGKLVDDEFRAVSVFSELLARKTQYCPTEPLTQKR